MCENETKSITLLCEFRKKIRLECNTFAWIRRNLYQDLFTMFFENENRFWFVDNKFQIYHWIRTIVEQKHFCNFLIWCCSRYEPTQSKCFEMHFEKFETISLIFWHESDQSNLIKSSMRRKSNKMKWNGPSGYLMCIEK